jgi:hypothetical protein
LQLGYQLCEGQEEIDHQRYEMTRESFEQKGGKIRKAVRSLAGNDNHAKVLFEPVDYEIGLAQKFEELLKAYSPQLEREETHEGIWYREKGIDIISK